MKLRMTTSLGHADGERLGLPGAREGDVVRGVPAADELIRRGWAVEVRAAPEPEPPPQPEPEPEPEPGQQRKAGRR